MPQQGLGIAPRLRYLAGRARRIDVGSVVERAREASVQHGKWTPAVIADMLWQAGFRNVGFQDYIDYDFAILNRAERATYMTHPVSNQLSQKYDQPEYRHIFQDKVEFDGVFDEFLRRDWMVVEEDNAAEVRAFAESHGTIVTKEPVGQAGTGVHRYHAGEIDDWTAFHRGLRERGELLIEAVIVQHPDLAAVCPGTVNTTRVTAFFDGERTHILAMAQKFGRGAVSDQMTFGGFYTMLDEDGHAMGAGYDSHGHVHEVHPDSGFRIADFQLPMIEGVKDFVDRVARVVPQVQYVGWDIVVTPDGPVLVEGNWGAGVYENKPSVTGIRTGHKPRYREAIGF
ncbi:MAG: flagellar biosynthesis protein [Microbacterium sp.]|mgnify:CR=1 FL=1|uniref:sugar-transfer associated ATP-grasp domain-containing protein n=1 Tax=Microbacterium sp. TaxID=51671 RepID=UPI00092A112A|nr:sugar-transfer associated ATP-grasp domain-containing protein [Microbacterium sp.]MBN9174808.1 flagellar biosynthesis protein [Microbacterium sp.]MBN9185982.1 flagellar biosynthesis protein [Microbacterium sp.]MBN9191325.1 flagellar biosynthesis protein [Microbacterium sp.]OJU71355.1 MAG: flagellar biosynthesis protein [Microbacterium sp. 70-38]